MISTAVAEKLPVSKIVTGRCQRHSSARPASSAGQWFSWHGRQCCIQRSCQLRAAGLFATASSAPAEGNTHGKHVFIFGLGYTALGIGNQLQKLGWTVSGTCRSEEKREVLKARGFQAYIFNPDDDGSLGEGGMAALLRADHLLTTIPPVADFNRDPVIEQHKVQLIEMAGNLAWVGYLSSTGVYGDYQGDWVNERSELRAANGSGAARAGTEHAWQQLHQQHNLPLHIFRLGGIYGPSRSALDAARKKTAPSSSQERRAKQRYTARCHVYDIWQAVNASMERPSPGSIYNVVDNDPAPRVQVVEYARALLLDGSATCGHEVGSSPDTKGSEQSTGSRSGERSQFQETSASDNGANTSSTGESKLKMPEKRVSNLELKESLGVVLRFPTYREGLHAIHCGDQSPFD